MQVRSSHQACAFTPKVFEPLAIGLIEAGEVGGILGEVLERIALLLEERAKIRGQIIGALVYPALVLASCGKRQPWPSHFHRTKIQRYV